MADYIVKKQKYKHVINISVTGNIQWSSPDPVWQFSGKISQVYFLVNRNSKKARWAPYEDFKVILPKWGLVHRGHRIILSKVSKGILTGFFRPAKHLSNTILQNHCSFEDNFTWKPSLKKMFGLFCTFDGVYI